MVLLVDLIGFLKEYSTIIPIITFILGAFIGFKTNLYIARRKEFIEISSPLHDALMAQLHAEGDRIFSNPVSKSDLLKLRSRYIHRTWFDQIKGIGFDRAVKQYQEQYHNSYTVNDSGRAVFTNHDAYLKTIMNLLKYTPIK
ncbi:hypothetical protein RFI02_19695 [Acinetobacter sichuanensis]|uniref:hypothetical protein n=1 Tax=Acinetobacter sichuanensis TaxID=2136183 RepID=UPI00280F4DC5|nr:hypothetical protein [Acinetobacter sichuanensis]MDQ9023323.1 hypothetical protein [Acinetobacter sichuanensis]